MIKLLGIPFESNSCFLQGPALAPTRIRQMEKDGSADEFSEDESEISKGKSYADGY